MSTQFENERYITFTLGKQHFAIPLLLIREVIALPEITKVPKTPSHVLGIANLRGQIITIHDLRQKLSITPVVSSEEAIIILNLPNINIGVVVDSVSSVLAPDPDKWTDKENVSATTVAGYVNGVYRGEEGLVVMLDLLRVLDIHIENDGANNLKSA